MSNLAHKSKTNITAAKLLCEKNLYASSIHCSYFGVFQLMKHVIKEHFNLNFHDQENELRNLRNTIASRGIGTHEYTINKVETAFIEKQGKSTNDFLIFNRQIKDLKKFRVDSDYKDVEVDIVKGGKALEYSSKLTEILKNVFL